VTAAAVRRVLWALKKGLAEEAANSGVFAASKLIPGS
jgi:hypothetical protein